MEINKKLISYNFNKGGNTKQYIVIHDTGNTNEGANAENHYIYFNGGNRGASAHYFVDDTQILQCVEDEDRSWHAGVKYGTPSRPEVNNSNSIGIEICVNKGSDYQKAYGSTVWLTAYLMRAYNIPIENVVTHYEACAKLCPASMSADNWQIWKEFKQDAELLLKKEDNTSIVRFNFFGVKTMGIGGMIVDGVTYVKARELLEAMRLKVEWNAPESTVMVGIDL